MDTKFYVDQEGNYLGGFSGYVSVDGPVYAQPPEGAIEISGPPNHGWQKYDLTNNVWLPLTDEQKQLLGMI